jgi:ABC-type transporter Mla subunit MlaD
MGIADQLSGALSDHADEIEEGIDKVADFIDDKTGDKFADKIDQVQDFLKDKLPGDGVQE